MAVHIHPLDIPPRFYKPLGQITACWNLTDALISSIIWHVHRIRSPSVGRLFTSRPNSVEKLNIFKVTADKYVSDPTVSAELLALHKRADKLRGTRNTYIHGLWGRMPNEHQTWKVFYLKGTDDTYTLRRHIVSLADLRAVAADLRQLNVDLKKVMRKIGAPPP